MSHWRLRVLSAVVAAATAACAVGCAAFVALPLPASFGADGRDGVVVEDRHGIVLRSTRAADGSLARWMPYGQLDPDLINAFVAVEDRRFWEHHGIDLRGVARAVRDDIEAGHVVSGASTITMQLARLLHPARRRMAGKFAQALWALRFEAHLTKQQILEQYLNRVELGQGAVGVGAASVLYFGASASQLSIAQAALLAGLAHAPSRDNPQVSARRARARRALALRRMRHFGYASAHDVARARAEPLVAPARTPPFLAPHFTTHVLAWSAAEHAAPGAALATSLDLALQSDVEIEVRHTVEELHDRGVTHAAVVVLDNRSGEVLAWVGSPDFWSGDDGQTDMVVSERQPGSALKPFLYGLAFDRGYTAASVLPDVPKTYATATGTYRPRDYDRRFRGPTRAREALASSYNVPAVELASRLGTGSLLETLHLAGFASLRQDAEYYGIGLALGNGDVTLMELANGYRAIANGGVWSPWTWHVVPAGVAGRAASGVRRVMSPMASALVLDILSDPSARLPGFGPSTPFDFPFRAAVKTGTSRHFTDNWAVGTTAGFTVAVWAGNFSGRPMAGVSGVTGAGPLLHRVMMAVAARVAPGALPTPPDAGATPVDVCRLSGLRATSECPRLTEWFAPGSEPTRLDDWERVGRVTLPAEYAEWAHQGLEAVSAPTTLAAIAPRTTSVILAGQPRRAPPGVRDAPDDAIDRVRFRITSPMDGDHYAIPEGIDVRYATIALRASGLGAERVRWSIDGRRIQGERWMLVPGSHEVRALSTRGDTAVARIEVAR